MEVFTCMVVALQCQVIFNVITSDGRKPTIVKLIKLKWGMLAWKSMTNRGSNVCSNMFQSSAPPYYGGYLLPAINRYTIHANLVPIMWFNFLLNVG